MKKQIQILLFFLFASTIGIGQNCYKNDITDISGINAGDILPELESIACQLRDSIGSNFTVYEGAVYRHSSKFNEGIEPFVQNIIEEVNSRSNYYILIVKVASDVDIFERVFVKLKLPTDGNYGCINRDFQNFPNNLQYLIESSINSDIVKNNINKYTVIRNGLKLMAEKLTSKKQCCFNSNRSNLCTDCEISKEQVISDLNLNRFNFYKDSIPVTPGSFSNFQNSNIYTNLNFTVDSLSKEQLISLFFNNMNDIGENNAKIIISDDQIYCDPAKLNEAKFIFHGQNYCLWIHLNLDGTSFELPSLRSNNYGKIYYKSNEKFGPIQCGDGWEDDDDVQTYKLTKQPYKKVEYENVAKNFDDVLFFCYKNSTNSSSSALQKNAWSTKWDNGFQGTAGEAECARIYNISIPSGTGIVYFEQTKDFVGAATHAAAASATTRIIHAPDKYTDLLLILGNVGATAFVIRCPEITRNFLSYNDFHRKMAIPPPLKEKKISSIGTVLIEVKTVGAKSAFRAVQTGILQLNTNQISSAAMPILAIDQDVFLKMMGTLNDRQIDDLERQLKTGNIFKGGIDLIKGLNCGTISRLQNLINEIREHPGQKPPVGYY